MLVLTAGVSGWVVDGGVTVETKEQRFRRLVGAQIRTQREHLGWTKDGLADRLVLAPWIIEAIEGGAYSFHVETLVQVCDLFETPVSEFLSAAGV